MTPVRGTERNAVAPSAFTARRAAKDRRGGGTPERRGAACRHLGRWGGEQISSARVGFPRPTPPRCCPAALGHPRPPSSLVAPRPLAGFPGARVRGGPAAGLTRGVDRAPCIR